MKVEDITAGEYYKDLEQGFIIKTLKVSELDPGIEAVQVTFKVIEDPKDFWVKPNLVLTDTYCWELARKLKHLPGYNSKLWKVINEE